MWQRWLVHSRGGGGRQQGGCSRVRGEETRACGSNDQQCNLAGEEQGGQKSAGLGGGGSREVVAGRKSSKHTMHSCAYR